MYKLTSPENEYSTAAETSSEAITNIMVNSEESASEKDISMGVRIPRTTINLMGNISISKPNSHVRPIEMETHKVQKYRILVNHSFLGVSDGLVIWLICVKIRL